MGQTLTHGIYLPNEGERNCYNGLAANWQLLDGAVGTIAEHTAALAGKANAVHTHTKADITDLFNSANTFTGIRPICVRGSNNDIYNVQPQSAVESQIAFVDKNNTAMSYITFQHRMIGTETHRLCLRQLMITDSGYYSVALNNLGNFYPENANTINLGTSTKKWKTLNGINPGALSLPSEDASSVNLDPTNWNITGTTANRYTPPADGWLGVQVMSKDTADLTGQYLFVGRASGGSDYYPEGGTTSINVNSGQGTLMGQAFIPVISGKEYHIRVKIGVDLTNGSSITARFYTCLGNV